MSTSSVCRHTGHGRRTRKCATKFTKQPGNRFLTGTVAFGYAGPNQQEWGVKGFRTGAKSVKEVAGMYEEMLRGMMSTPYYIGWHHCGSIEQWDESERGDSPRNENGLLDPMENQREEWANVLRNINPTA